MGRLGPGIASAVGAAGLFGLSTPAAKLLLGVADPWMVAGLLYLGSGTGLALLLLIRRARSGRVEAPLGRADLPWLLAAIGLGGVLGPVLLMFGLAAGSASQSALLLNLEGVFTTLLAWLVFHEHVSRRIAAGMAAITLGALGMGWDPSGGLALDWAALLVAAACLAWALDNNLTRRIAGGDPVQIAALKGFGAGAVNVVPSRVVLTVDARAPDAGRLERLLAELDAPAKADVQPIAMHESVRAVLREEIEKRGLAAPELPSGAGHDAGVLAAAGVEAGMLFVRSLNGGVSHSPNELTSDEDIDVAVDVLASTLRRLSAR